MYVVSMGVTDDVFWDMPVSTVKTIAENKSAYDGWLINVKDDLRSK